MLRLQGSPGPIHHRKDQYQVAAGGHAASWRGRRVLAPCSEKIISALTQLAGEGRSKEAFLQAMRDATNGMTKLCGPSAPASVYTTLQQVFYVLQSSYACLGSASLGARPRQR